MNIFTANQVNQVYVVKGENALKTDASEITTEGQIYVGTTTPDGDIYFVHKGKGGITRSDLIPKKEIMYCKYTPAYNMQMKPMAATISLNENAYTTSSNVKYTLPQDYVLNIEFQNPIGMSPDNKYLMTAAVHGTTTMTASAFYEKLKEVLDKQIKKLGTALITTSLVGSSGSYTGMTITAANPDWIRGIKQQKPILFTVLNSVVTKQTGSNPLDKEDFYWVDVIYSNKKKVIGGVEPTETVAGNGDTVPTTTPIKNGKLMADFEYFYMGERGDQYRMKTWPDYVPTEYMVDPAKEYDTIGIHFAYVGSNHAVQKSEKDITLIVERTTPSGENAKTIDTLTTSIKEAIEAAIDAPYSKSEADEAFGE